MEFSNNKIKNILEIASKGNDFSEIYYEKSHGTQIVIENSKIEKLSTGIDEGIGIRIVKNGKTKYGFTNDCSYDNLEKIAMELNIINENSEKTAINSKFVTKEAPKLYEKAYKDVDIKKKITLLKEADLLGHEIAKYTIKQLTGSYADSTKEIQIFNSKGEHTIEHLNRGILRFNTVMSKDEIVQTGYASKATTKGFEYFEKSPNEKMHKDMIRESIRVAETMLEADTPISGKMDVILSGKAGGTMIHEACGHGLELDLVQDNISIFKGKIDEKVANEKITVIDSGTDEGYFGSSYFDGEGNKTEKTILIENGIIKKYMNSRITANKEGIKYTGNGRRESYKCTPIPRMRNTYIKNGTDKLDEMLSEVKKGIYVVKMGGGQVDTVTGDFVFNVIESYIIEDGKIKNAIRNVTLSGNGKDMLNDITHVGDDLQFTVGTCGKDGQGVPVTTGQPTIKIKHVLVGGLS